MLSIILSLSYYVHVYVRMMTHKVFGYDQMITVVFDTVECV